MTRGVLIALDQMFLSGCDWCEADLLDGYFQMQNCQGDSRPITGITLDAWRHEFCWEFVMAWYVKILIALATSGLLVGLIGAVTDQEIWFYDGGGVLLGSVLLLYIWAIIKRPELLLELEDGVGSEDEPPIKLPVAEQVLSAKDRGMSPPPISKFEER
jgi:hypothetical protein